MKLINCSIKNKIIFCSSVSVLASNLLLLYLFNLTLMKESATENVISVILPASWLPSTTANQFFIIALLFILICTLLSYFLIYKLTKPLQELVFASNQLGNDVSTINFPTNSNDELATLASSLESMNRTIIKQNESLKNSELMNRSIMENMSDGLITITTEGLINSFNKTAETLFGYLASEIEGKPFTMLISEPHRTELEIFLKKFSRSQLQTLQNDIELIGVRKDGSTFDMELSITEMILQSRKLGDKHFFIGLCRNIEERKKNELQLRSAEKIAVLAKDEAERANLAKSQFLSRMSHEFRTPLNAVMGFSQLILYDDEAICDKDLMQAIYNAGERLLLMVNNVLDIASLDTGKMELKTETVDVKSVVHEAYKEAMALAKQNQNEIKLSIKDSQSPIFIQADKERVKQILLILLTNAINFNQKPGIVTLSLRETNKGQIGICVKDQGIGIAKENLELIFKPFERLDAYNRGIDGLGIGLAIAKHLTESMGGTIGVESSENVGSLFYVFFPLYDPEVEVIFADLGLI